MDHCRRVWFITPAGYVARFLGIIATYALIVLSFVLCS